MRFVKKLAVWTLRILGIAVLAVVLGTLAINLYIKASAKPHIVTDATELESAPVGMILGASVTSRGVLSPALQDRVDHALVLYEQGIIENFLVSGDNGTRQYDEVSPVRLYLLDQGVPEDDIYLDYAGFDTYDSMYRARDIFGVTDMVIVTQQFHLYRAVYLARALGINAQGYPADALTLGRENNTREIAARVKSFFELLFDTKPTYLGESVEIK